MKWEEWYKIRRDELTENIGKISAFQVRQTGPKWDKYILERIRDSLDSMNMVWQDIGELFKQDSELIKRLEKRDNDIADVLVKVQGWMKKYQPILDAMDEEYDVLEKVKKK
jgi:hypothetical protein